MTMTDDRTDEKGSALVTIEAKDAYRIFTEEGATAPIIHELRLYAKEAPTDVSTLKGRRAIASYSAKFSTSKSFLESFGKELADEQKAIPKKIDAARKLLKDTCDALRDQVRAPLDAWEEAEERRVAAHRKVVDDLVYWAREAHGMSRDQVVATLAEATATEPDNYEEFADEIARARQAAIEALTAAAMQRDKEDADRRELEELRKLKAERDEADRKAAAEKAESDRQAQAERDAEERAKAAAEIAVQAERARIEAQAQAERDAAAAREAALERQAKEAKDAQERAEREARDAVAKAQREAAEAKATEDAASAARESDKAHRGRINREALDDLIAAGLTEDLAKIALTAIVRREVRHVAIAY